MYTQEKGNSRNVSVSMPDFLFNNYFISTYGFLFLLVWFLLKQTQLLPILKAISQWSCHFKQTSEKQKAKHQDLKYICGATDISWKTLGKNPV